MDGPHCVVSALLTRKNLHCFTTRSCTNVTRGASTQLNYGCFVIEHTSEDFIGFVQVTQNFYCWWMVLLISQQYTMYIRLVESAIKITAKICHDLTLCKCWTVFSIAGKMAIRSNINVEVRCILTVFFTKSIHIKSIKPMSYCFHQLICCKSHLTPLHCTRTRRWISPTICV